MIIENQLVASSRNKRTYVKCDILVLAQRTNNIRKAQPEQQKKFLKENVTNRKINRVSRKINLHECQKHCQKSQLIQILTPKNYRENFQSSLPGTAYYTLLKGNLEK